MGSRATEEPRGHRYRTSTGEEGAYQPGSRHRVLRNLRGIIRKSEMDREEIGALVRVQDAYLQIIEEDTRFTAALICQMHRDWLGELYLWAGRYRTVELAKAGFSWPPAQRVAANMETFEQGLLTDKTPCLPGSMDRILRRSGSGHNK